MLWLAAFPLETAPAMAGIAASLFDIPCSVVPNFLCLTLTPSNQIIHPARYHGIFRDWDGKRTYSMQVRDRWPARLDVSRGRRNTRRMCGAAGRSPFTPRDARCVS